MNRFTNSIALALVLFAVSGQAAHAGQPAQLSDEEQILKLEQDWQRAWSQGDRATLNALLDDTYVETTYTGAERHKMDVVIAPPPPPTAVQVLDDVRPEVRGDTAIVSGTGSYRESPGSRPIRFTFMDVFAKRDGKWRAIAGKMAPLGS